MFLLVNLLISLALYVASIAVEGLVVLYWLYGLALFLPGLTVAVRRLHDTNRSGWWVLIGLIPFIGFIVLLVFLVQDSDPGTNQYGPSPKAVPA
jgi:uncharacterized membrane protein YhaH (DUF805 family)